MLVKWLAASGGAVRVVQYIKSSHTKPGPPAGCSISLPSHPTPAATRLQLEAVHNLALAGLPLRPCPSPLFLPRRTCRLPRGLGSRKVGLLQHPGRCHLRTRGGTIVMGCLHTLLRCKNAERMACTAAHQQQRRWGCNATEQVWLLPKMQRRSPSNFPASPPHPRRLWMTAHAPGRRHRHPAERTAPSARPAPAAAPHSAVQPAHPHCPPAHCWPHCCSLTGCPGGRAPQPPRLLPRPWPLAAPLPPPARPAAPAAAPPRGPAGRR